jgi:lipoic acid synthetase
MSQHPLTFHPSQGGPEAPEGGVATRNAETRKPEWLKVPLPGGEGYSRLKRMTRALGLNTVCEAARCPNVGECWKGERATMTIMVLGDECTRRCRFCAVKTVDEAAAPDPMEPENVGRAIAELDPGYVVITSVDRDDLSDGGAAHYAECVREIHERAPRTIVETLTPDYTGGSLAILLDGAPEVLAHNVEVVPRLQRKIRDPRCSFERSLETLSGAKAYSDAVVTKSSLMLGFGEDHHEVIEAMIRLRDAGCDLLTLGQYLRPTKKHAPVREYVTPERFEEYRASAEELGFLHVNAGPLVRSSYRAGELFAERFIRERRANSTPGEGA